MKDTKWWLLGIKAWGYIVIAIIVCFMLALFFGFDSIWVKIAVQIIDLFIFGGLIYKFFWKAGSTDSNKVELKMAEKDPLKGVKAGVTAAVPYMIFWIALLIAKVADASVKVGDIIIFIYSFLNVPFAPIINNVIFSFGGSYAQTSVLSIILSLFSALFVTAVSALAYDLGYRQYIIMDHIIYKNLGKKS